MQRPLLIGISGGTGSGKTVFAKNIARGLDPGVAAIIAQDSYYENLDHLPLDARHQRNFDHPEAFDWKLLTRHAGQFIRGEQVAIPIYDYRTHTRTTETRSISGYPVIILEGILILWNPELRAMLDLKVYIDVDDDIRFIRRLRRDIEERGRTMESVIEQYQETVRPMHRQYVAPTRRYADFIIPEGGQNSVALKVLCSAIHRQLSNQPPASH